MDTEKIVDKVSLHLSSNNINIITNLGITAFLYQVIQVKDGIMIALVTLPTIIMITNGLLIVALTFKNAKKKIGHFVIKNERKLYLYKRPVHCILTVCYILNYVYFLIY